MGHPIARFYIVEHPVGMILAAILITIGFRAAKKTNLSDKAKYVRILIYYTLGFAIITYLIPFAHAFLGNTLSKLEPTEAAKFRTHSKGLSQMGTVGTVLLLVSGVYLIIPFWPVITTLPLLILKLVLFVILVILILLINNQEKFYRDLRYYLGRIRF